MKSRSRKIRNAVAEMAEKAVNVLTADSKYEWNAEHPGYASVVLAADENVEFKAILSVNNLDPKVEVIAIYDDEYCIADETVLSLRMADCNSRDVDKYEGTPLDYMVDTAREALNLA
jgi:hypothetical protein